MKIKSFEEKAKNGVAIILGLDSVTSIGLIRCLAEGNLLIYALDQSGKRLLSGGSKYCITLTSKKFFTENEFLSLILKIGDQHYGNPSLIFSTSEEMTLFIERNKDVLGKYFTLPRSKKYSLEQLIDKNIIEEDLKKNDIDIPASKLFTSKEEILNSPILYPIVIKPLNSIGTSKKDIHIIENPKDLKKCLSKIKYTPMLIQEYIPGGPENMIEVMGFSSRKLKKLIHLVIKKIRQYPPIKGSSSYIGICEDPLISKISEKIMDILDLDGLIDIEFKKSNKDGKIYFLEINARAGAPILLSKDAGYNLPLNYFNDVSNGSVDDFNPKSIDWNRKWIKEYADWLNVFESDDCSLIQYIKSFSWNTTFSLFDIRDINPTFNFAKEALKKLIQNISSQYQYFLSYISYNSKYEGKIKVIAFAIAEFFRNIFYSNYTGIILSLSLEHQPHSIDDVELNNYNIYISTDTDEISEFYKNVGRKIEINKITEFLNKGYHCWLVKKNDKVIAATWVYFNNMLLLKRSGRVFSLNKNIILKPNVGYIAKTIVHNPWRGYGIGKILIKKIATHYSSLNITHLIVTTSISNSSNLAVWFNCGAKIASLVNVKLILGRYKRNEYYLDKNLCLWE